MTARSPTMVTLHDTRFVECRWWNDGWTVKTRHLTVVGLHDTGPWCSDGCAKLASADNVSFARNKPLSTTESCKSQALLLFCFLTHCCKCHIVEIQLSRIKLACHRFSAILIQKWVEYAYCYFQFRNIVISVRLCSQYLSEDFTAQTHLHRECYLRSPVGS